MPRKNTKKSKNYKNTIKGRLFEFVLRRLIERSGFKTNLDRSDLPQLTKNLKKLHGRGGTYAADLIGIFRMPIPFAYPFLLIGEAKNYKSRIGIGEARAFLGAFTDISQYPRIDTRSKVLKFSQIFKSSRFTYIPVMFASNGFNRNAQAFLYAHGVYFVSYENSSIINGIRSKIEEVTNKINYKNLNGREIKNLDSIEKFVKLNSNFKITGYDSAIMELTNSINPIISYIGVIDNKWPIHFLTRRKIALNTALRYAKFSIKNNEIAIKYMGKFSLPSGFLKEYIKIAGGESKILHDLILYLPAEERIIPLYIKLTSEERDLNRKDQQQ